MYLKLQRSPANKGEECFLAEKKGGSWAGVLFLQGKSIGGKREVSVVMASHWVIFDSVQWPYCRVRRKSSFSCWHSRDRHFLLGMRGMSLPVGVCN